MKLGEVERRQRKNSLNFSMSECSCFKISIVSQPVWEADSSLDILSLGAFKDGKFDTDHMLNVMISLASNTQKLLCILCIL